MSTPSPDDKVYELSAQGQSAVVSFNVPQALEGKGIVNVIRCRLPLQYSTHPGSDDMEIVQVKYLDNFAPSNYPSPFHNQELATPTIEYGTFGSVSPGNTISLNKNAVGKVRSYNTPSQAIHNLEMAYLHTSVVASSSEVKYVAFNAGSIANEFWFEIFVFIEHDDYYYVQTGNGAESVYMTTGLNRLSNWLPTDHISKTIHLKTLLNNFVEGPTISRNGNVINDTRVLRYIKDTSGAYSRPKIIVDGGLKVTLATGGSTKPYFYNEITAHRLNFDTLDSTEHVGKSQPHLNDCKKIILTLTPQTQTLVTRHKGQQSVFQNASITFSVFDDASGGDTDQIYSLSGDFMTNALLKVGSGQSYAFRLQRFTVDPLKSDAQVDDIIMPPNSFTEIKYKMSPLETPKPVVQTDYPPISAPRPVPELVTQTTESSATRPYAMIGGEIPISSIEGRAAVRPRLQ